MHNRKIKYISQNYTLRYPVKHCPSGIRRIRISNDSAGTHSYQIYKGILPYLEVQVPVCSWNPFDMACIFHDYLCIGCGSQVYFLHMATGAVNEINVDLYFGAFYIEDDRLYIASESHLYCFDIACRQIWKSRPIAIDGVILVKHSGDTLLVSCEMDPPGGWISRQISAKDGQETV